MTRRPPQGGQLDWSPTLPDEDENSAHQDSVRMVVDELMRQMEPSYCDYKDLTIFIGTYNVNGQFPSVGVTPWLSEGLQNAPDIYAVGFQELDLSVQALANLRESPREPEWASIVENGLHPNSEYSEVARMRLVGILLLVYVKKTLKKHIKEDSISSSYLATGLLNVAGNKGGVAVRLKVFDTTVTFVNSHLAAGNDELERRNQDFRQISSIEFGTKKEGTLRLEDHDITFWLGDLNYRLQYPSGSSPEVQAVKLKIASKDYLNLMQLDQLIQMQQTRKAFFEFDEGPLTFPPTYKYDPGTDSWDSSDKQRAPAWCDRVLWLKNSNTHVNLEEYISIPEVRLSDHKPVRAVFQLKAKQIDPRKQRRVYEEALKEGDRMANEALPVVELDNFEFNFENVGFLEPQVQTLQIKNVGKFPVQFRFRRKPGSADVSKPHIIITPISHKINVGSECLVDIQLSVDKSCAWNFENKKETVDDILVLHLNGGRDHFLMINGNYLNSCFGKTIEELVKKRLGSEELLIDLGNDLTGDIRPERWKDVPLELFRLVDHLERNGLDEQDLFSQTGSHSDFIAIRKCLDSGSPAEIPGSIHSAADAVLRFLDSLQEPVIPAVFTDRMLRLSGTPKTCWDAVDDLTGHLRSHGRTLKYLIEFLKNVLAHADANGTNVDILSTIFSAFLFRLNPQSLTTGMVTKSSSSKALEEAKRNRGEASVLFIKNLLISDKKLLSMEDQLQATLRMNSSESSTGSSERKSKGSSAGSISSLRQGNSNFYQ